MRVTIKTEHIIMSLLIMLGIFQYIGSGFLSIATTLLIVLTSAFLPISALIIALHMCLPFFNLMNRQLGSVSMYYLLIIIFALRYVLSKEPKYKLLQKLFLLVFLFLIRVWDVGPRFFSWYLLLIPLVLSYKEDFFAKSLIRIISATSMSMILSCFFGFVMMVNNLSIYDHSYVWNQGTITTRFAGLIGDSVFLGMMLALLVALNFVILASFSNKKLPVLYIVAMCVFGLITYSRIFVAAILFCIVFFFMITIKSRKCFGGFALLLASLSVTILIILQSSDLLAENFTLRFLTQDLTTGRLSIIEHYANLIRLNPLSLFIGISYYDYTMPFIPAGRVSISRYAHNIFLESIFVFGLFFAICFMIIGIYKLIKYVLSNGITIELLPLFVLILYGFVLHGHFAFSYYASAALVLGVLSCRTLSERML